MLKKISAITFLGVWAVVAVHEGEAQQKRVLDPEKAIGDQNVLDPAKAKQGDLESRKEIKQIIKVAKENGVITEEIVKALVHSKVVAVEMLVNVAIAEGCAADKVVLGAIKAGAPVNQVLRGANEADANVRVIARAAVAAGAKRKNVASILSSISPDYDKGGEQVFGFSKPE